MTALSPIQLEKAFQESQSGRGYRLTGVTQLEAFAVYTRSRDAVVCNVETFEIVAEAHVLRIDLSVFQGGHEEQALSAAERINMHDASMNYVVGEIAREGIDCVFNVWADELQDIRS